MSDVNLYFKMYKLMQKIVKTKNITNLCKKLNQRKPMKYQKKNQRKSVQKSTWKKFQQPNFIDEKIHRHKKL
jgi:hypothetical protein